MATNQDTFADTSKLNELVGSEVTGGVLQNELFTDGNVIEFDGSGDYVRGATLGIAGTGLTMSTWVYVDTWSNFRQIGGQNYHSCANPYMPYHFQVSSGSISFLLSTGGGSRTTLSFAKSSIEGKWFHLGGTYDGATMKLFVNGVPVSSVAKTGNITSTTGYFSIGGFLACGGGDWFDGKLSDYRVYSRALSDEEMFKLYKTSYADSTSLELHWMANEGSGSTLTDSSGNGYTGTFFGGTSWASKDLYNLDSRTTSEDLLL